MIVFDLINCYVVGLCIDVVGNVMIVTNVVSVYVGVIMELIIIDCASVLTRKLLNSTKT